MTWDLRYIYQSEPDKACSQYDMAYEDFKDFPMRTASVSALRDKAFNIAKNPKYDGYQCAIASMINEFLNKRSSDGAIICVSSEALATRDISAIKSEIMSNQQSAKELRKAPIQHATSRERPLMVLFWLRRPGP